MVLLAYESKGKAEFVGGWEICWWGLSEFIECGYCYFFDKGEIDVGINTCDCDLANNCCFKL